jgi:hypothetical protein
MVLRSVTILVFFCMGRPAVSEESVPPDPEQAMSAPEESDENEPPTSSDGAPRAPESDPCDGITCSNHGNCVMLKESPTCACFEGYAPDTVNGLNCVPAVAPRNAPQDTPSKEASSGEDLAALTVALDGYDLSNALHSYWSRPEGRSGERFSDYLIRRFEDAKRNGVTILAIGVLSFAGSAVFYGLGMARENELIYGGLALDILGTVLIISGAVTVGVNNARVNKIKRFQAASKQSGWRFEHLGPMVSKRGLPDGIAASFRF